MILASDVKSGTVLQMDGKLYRILDVIRHAGSGQMHGFIELKMKDIRTGHGLDRRLKLADKLDDVDLHRRTMDFLYSDSDALWFMDPESFEQVSVPREAVGPAEKFMSEGTKVSVELVGGEAVAVHCAKVVEAKVAQTGPGIRGGQDNTMKPAVLDNGVGIQVPQFIETGDTVKVDVEKLRYVERVLPKHA